MKDPGWREDVKNGTTVAVGAGLAALLTVGVLFARSGPDFEEPYVPRVEIAVDIEDFEPAVEIELVEPVVDVDFGPLDGSNRLYGTVHTRDGAAHTGFIRWDRNEGSWADLLDANKLRRRGSATQAGLRFGHIRSMEVLDRQSALFTLKSGERVELGSRSTDLGTGLRALLVEDPDRGSSEYRWSDLERIEFRSAPDGVLPPNARLYGTLTTRTGLTFTGYVTWDVDEIYSVDVLDGEDRFGDDREIPFGSIAEIARNSSSSARVTLRDGEEMVLRGTNDVDRSNGGISVSDAALGQVKVDWDEFESVRFHPAETQVGYGVFRGGGALVGTVLTEDGRELRGTIAWDADEASAWEMLNGEADRVDFQIEFGNIARIEKTMWGSLVELRDGRAFELSGSNDVDDGNRGIRVTTVDGQTRTVSWDAFREMRLGG